MLRIGEWTVDPASGEIARGEETARLETRALRLLLYLAERQGQVVSIDELLTHVWAGVTVSQDSAYQAVTSLRRQLGDDPRQPAYIATVPRLGYRMVATVSQVAAAQAGSASVPPQPVAPTSAPHAPRGRRRQMVVAAGAAIFVAALVLVMLNGGTANRHRSASAASVAQPANSVAVLPFLDLTEGMKNEEFADGMTEELIDKLSKIP